MHTHTHTHEKKHTKIITNAQIYKNQPQGTKAQYEKTHNDKHEKPERTGRDELQRCYMSQRKETLATTRGHQFDKGFKNRTFSRI